MSLSIRPLKFSRAVVIGMFFLLLGMATTPDAVARKYAALVMDASTGKVLHSRRANDLRHPASITKVMTLYMLFEAMEQGKFTMNSLLKVSRKATHAPPSRLGLPHGGKISVKDAIGILITKSANDVAVVVAEALAGSEAEFAKRMTAKARSLGMKRTTFRNASGLHHRKQITTAHDIALMAQKVRQNFPQYYHMFKWRSYSYKGRKYRNHNKLLGAYPGMEGMKTGFINASGFNLVAVAKRNNQRVITVVFGGKSGRSRDRQVRKLMDLGFSRLPNLTVMQAPPPRAVKLASLNSQSLEALTTQASRAKPQGTKLASIQVLHAPMKTRAKSTANASTAAATPALSGQELIWQAVTAPAKKPTAPAVSQQVELNFTIVE